MARTSREIKRRIASISSTQQITRAMEMVAAAKLRKVQDRVATTRPYYDRLALSLAVVLRAAQRSGQELPAIAQRREGERHCLLVLSSDRGLAGGYNAHIIRQAEAFLQAHPQTEMVIVGKKARDYFRRRNRTALAEYVGLGDEPQVRQASDIAQVIIDFYLHGLFDKFTILYTQFVNTMTQKVALRPVLPIPDNLGGKEQPGSEPIYLFEPSANAVLEGLIPLYVNAAIYQSLIEAKASEMAARMNAMSQATDNAAELIEELNRTFHRMRQAQITKEIAEIVGGADALES
ncbi:MAG: ATP synthase F1 subunit gamma [Firmicutes bacterium]|nr:ATP synthase F1 subunit gamma [Bacillota bacterium]